MSDSQCGCVPNKIVAAQILSLVASGIAILCWAVLSLYGWSYPYFNLGVTLASLFLTTFYQVLWCFSFPKKLHWALIVPALIISGCNFYTTIYSFWFWPFLLCYGAQAVLWLIAAILQLVFLFTKSEIKENAEDADNVDAVEDV